MKSPGLEVRDNAMKKVIFYDASFFNVINTAINVVKDEIGKRHQLYFALSYSGTYLCLRFAVGLESSLLDFEIHKIEMKVSDELNALAREDRFTENLVNSIKIDIDWSDLSLPAEREEFERIKKGMSKIFI